METMDRNAGRSRAIPGRCGAQNAALYARTALNAQLTRLSPNFACCGSQVHGARGRPLKTIQPQGGGLRFWHPRLADARARAAVCRLRRYDLLPARLPSGRAAKDPARHAAAARRVRGICTHTAAFPSFFHLFATCTHMPLLSHPQNRILLQCWEVEPARRPELSAVLPVLDELLRQHGDYRPTTAPGGTSRSRRASRG